MLLRAYGEQQKGSTLEDSWNFWDDPCENWRVTCEGLNFVQYGGPLGPKCQQWPSCNHQWSRGTCLDLGTVPSRSGGSNPPLENNVKGFNPKYKIISCEWC